MAPTKATEERRQRHSQDDWSQIRPVFKHFYVDLDMTLRDTMERLDKDHGFHATEQIFKKRIRTWELQKNVKADKKEKAILGLLQNPSAAAATTRSIRYDKLIRYAKSRTKPARPDKNSAKGTVQWKNTSNYSSPATGLPVTPMNAVTLMPRALAPEKRLADLDLFLKAMRSIISREREEWLTKPHQNPSAILDALIKGVSLCRRNDIPAACKFFRRAARDTTEDLQNKYVSRVCYCISSLVWGSIKHPQFDRFAHFLARSGVEKLGHGNPLTILLQHLPEENSVDAQLAIWSCALDDYEVSEQNADHWWGMAQRRWRWCRQSGRLDLAEYHCLRAMSECRRVKKLTKDKVLQAQQEHEAIKLASIIQRGVISH